MKHAWTILCRKSSIDKDTNNLSLFDSFEELHVTPTDKLPDKAKQGLPVNFEIVSLWYDNDPSTESKGTLRIELYDSKNKKFKEFDHEFVIPKNFKRMRTRIRMIGLPMSEAGDYIFKIKYQKSDQTNYTLATELPFEIRYQDSVGNVMNKINRKAR